MHAQHANGINDDEKELVALQLWPNEMAIKKAFQSSWLWERNRLNKLQWFTKWVNFQKEFYIKTEISHFLSLFLELKFSFIFQTHAKWEISSWSFIGFFDWPQFHCVIESRPTWLILSIQLFYNGTVNWKNFNTI